MNKRIRSKIEVKYENTAIPGQNKERRVWECYVCHKKEVWSTGWMVYNSIRDQEDGSPLLVSCSDVCRKERSDPEQDLADLWAEKDWSSPPPTWPYSHKTKLGRIGKKKPKESAWGLQ